MDQSRERMREALEESEEWPEPMEELIKKKNRFLVRITLGFLGVYFALPLGILFFPNGMALEVFHHSTVAWAMACFQFVVIWGLGSLYYFKAKRFDQRMEKAAPWRRKT